jgi:hypothetical protein
MSSLTNLLVNMLVDANKKSDVVVNEESESSTADTSTHVLTTPLHSKSVTPDLCEQTTKEDGGTDEDDDFTKDDDLDFNAVANIMAHYEHDEHGYKEVHPCSSDEYSHVWVHQDEKLISMPERVRDASPSPPSKKSQPPVATTREISKNSTPKTSAAAMMEAAEKMEEPAAVTAEKTTPKTPRLRRHQTFPLRSPESPYTGNIDWSDPAITAIATQAENTALRSFSQPSPSKPHFVVDEPDGYLSDNPDFEETLKSLPMG